MERRFFLKVLAALSAGGCAADGDRERSAASASSPEGGTGARPIGIQLYTVRELLRADAASTLAALAEMGYAEVELAGLHGHAAARFRALLDGSGLRAPAGHVGLEALLGDGGRTLEDAIELGHEYVVVPWIEAAQRTLAGYRAIAQRFNAAGEAARRVGLRFAYHNHDFEFEPIGGVVPYDVLLAETDPALVSFELDLYWIRHGGGDALDYFARHPGRFPLVHVKDRDAAGRMVDIGAGEIDFAAVIAAADRAGIRHYFIEHDSPADPLGFARAGYTQLRAMLG